MRLMSSAGHWAMGQRREQQRMRTTDKALEGCVNNLMSDGKLVISR